MIPREQSRTGEQGTCFRAALASILNLREQQVPDFELAGEDYWDVVDSWLAERGLVYRRVPAGGLKPVGWSTIEGVSLRGGLHACIAYDGKLVHDPHPKWMNDGQGLIEVKWYGVLEPMKTRTTDESQMQHARKAIRKQGLGAFTIQVTEPNGLERVEPVSVLRTYDAAHHTIKDARRDRLHRALDAVLNG